LTQESEKLYAINCNIIQQYTFSYIVSTKHETTYNFVTSSTSFKVWCRHRW